jgi:hypothetical protein
MYYIKNEINERMKNPPSGNQYHKKDGVIDTSKSKNLERFGENIQGNCNA